MIAQTKHSFPITVVLKDGTTAEEEDTLVVVSMIVKGVVDVLYIISMLQKKVVNVPPDALKAITTKIALKVATTS